MRILKMLTGLWARLLGDQGKLSDPSGLKDCPRSGPSQRELDGREAASLCIRDTPPPGGVPARWAGMLTHEGLVGYTMEQALANDKELLSLLAENMKLRLKVATHSTICHFLPSYPNYTTMQAQQLEGELKSYRAEVKELKAENMRLREQVYLLGPEADTLRRANRGLDAAEAQVAELKAVIQRLRMLRREALDNDGSRQTQEAAAIRSFSIMWAANAGGRRA